MDYKKYVQENVQDSSIRDRILGEIKYFQENYPKSWEWDFINNFHSLIDPDRPSRNYRMWCGRVPITDRTTFREFDYSNEISEKLKGQTIPQFFKTVDDTVQSMGFSVGELIRPVKETSAEPLIKIMIELMKKGYYRYPDLAR